MSGIAIGGSASETSEASGFKSEAAPALRAAGWLSLAAAPVFALMALLTAAHGGAADTLCSAAPDGLPLDGMTLMYVLMSVFHSAPWIRLIFGGSAAARAARAGASIRPSS